MFKPHYASGVCPDCPPDKVVLIVVRSGFCQRHNQERKKEKKANRIRVNEPKVTEALNDLYKIKKRRKPTGELALFRQIYEEQNGLCMITKKKIPFNINCFLHILSKGAFPKFRLYKSNVLLVQEEIHYLYDNSSKDKLFEKFPGSIEIYNLKDKLKSIYYE